VRKRIEESFGWIKTTAGLRKTRHRGTARVGWMFTLNAAACNLVRLPASARARRSRSEKHESASPPLPTAPNCISSASRDLRGHCGRPHRPRRVDSPAKCVLRPRGQGREVRRWDFPILRRSHAPERRRPVYVNVRSSPLPSVREIDAALERKYWATRYLETRS
jgi:hypothetical protein